MTSMEEKITVEDTNFHPVLKDIENIFWLFLLSTRALADPDIQTILKTKNERQEAYICFNQMLEKFNKTTNLKIERSGDVATSKLNIFNQMIFMGKAMAILTYDYLSLSRYNNDINGGEEFVFLRFIRNGAAHYNKFNLKDEAGNWKLAEDETIGWRDKRITRALHNSVVFNDFIGFSEIFLLAKYFSEKLTEIDKQRKK